MDINTLLTAGEWMDIPGLEGLDELGPFRLKIAPIDPLAFPEVNMRDERAVCAILDLVVGWDIMDGDKQAEFTAEKKKVLARILPRRVKEQTGEFGDRLFLAIIRFATGPEVRAKSLDPTSSGTPTGAGE